MVRDLFHALARVTRAVVGKKVRGYQNLLAAIGSSLGARQRRDVKPRMLVNKVARIEDVPLSEVPY